MKRATILERPKRNRKPVERYSPEITEMEDDNDDDYDSVDKISIKSDESLGGKPVDADDDEDDGYEIKKARLETYEKDGFVCDDQELMYESNASEEDDEEELLVISSNESDDYYDSDDDDDDDDNDSDYEDESDSSKKNFDKKSDDTKIIKIENVDKNNKIVTDVEVKSIETSIENPIFNSEIVEVINIDNNVNQLTDNS